MSWLFSIPFEKSKQYKNAGKRLRVYGGLSSMMWHILHLRQYTCYNSYLVKTDFMRYKNRFFLLVSQRVHCKHSNNSLFMIFQRKYYERSIGSLKVLFFYAVSQERQPTSYSGYFLRSVLPAKKRRPWVQGCKSMEGVGTIDCTEYGVQGESKQLSYKLSNFVWLGVDSYKVLTRRRVHSNSCLYQLSSTLIHVLLGTIRVETTFTFFCQNEPPSQ